MPLDLNTPRPERGEGGWGVETLICRSVAERRGDTGRRGLPKARSEARGGRPFWMMRLHIIPALRPWCVVRVSSNKQPRV